MTGVPKDPSNRQLLERIAALEAENAGLAARVDDLEKRATSSHEFFMRLADKTGILNEQVIELMEKVFPGHARTQLQIIKIFRSKDKTGSTEQGRGHD